MLDGRIKGEYNKGKRREGDAMWIAAMGLFALACLGYYGVCIHRLSIRCSISYFWLLLGIFFAVSAALPRFFWLLSLPFFLFWLLFCIFLLVQSRSAPGKGKPDVLIVLGARCDGTLPDEIFTNRVRLAASLLEQNPALTCILSGGSVFGEEESEARSLHRALTALGVDPARLTLEEESRTTVENLRLALPKARGAACLGIVTSGFHRYRAERCARAAGWQGEICVFTAPAPGWLLPHLYIREFFTFSTDLLRGNLSAEK